MKLPLPKIDAPAAIAFSGGGDSTAMVHAFAGHDLIRHVIIVDHGLRAGSDTEANRAAAFARDLGYHADIVTWRPGDLGTAIQVKARRFRYAAMGEVCRRHGLTHLLTAHTADDQAETLLMRLDRQTGWRGLAGMREEAYAPLWPALAGVTLHRPWLGISRAELRDYNTQYDLAFTDDPSNENRDFTRVRARQALSADPALRADLLVQQAEARLRLDQERQVHAAWLHDHAEISADNFIITDSVPPSEVLLHILRAVSGTGGPIDGAKRAGLVARMGQPDFTAATLAGSWVVKSDDWFIITRDMVARRRELVQNALGMIDLAPGQTQLWDGRFWITAHEPGIRVATAHGLGPKIRQSPESQRFYDLPKAVRSTLPVYLKHGEVRGLGACDTSDVTARATAARRLQDIFPRRRTQH